MTIRGWNQYALSRSPLNPVHSGSRDCLESSHTVRHEFFPIEREPLNLLEMARIVGGFIQPVLDHILHSLVLVEAFMLLGSLVEVGDLHSLHIG